MNMDHLVKTKGLEIIVSDKPKKDNEKDVKRFNALVEAVKERKKNNG